MMVLSQKLIPILYIISKQIVDVDKEKLVFYSTFAK